MSDCILWKGKVDRHGYGLTWRDGGWRLAHRVAYEDAHGPIADGLEVHHHCSTRLCVNIDHLEPVTRAQHARYSMAATKVVCVNGHLYDEANTYIRPNDNRDCRRCTRERQRQCRARQKAAA